VELATASLDANNISLLHQDPALAGVLDGELADETADMELDPTVLQVDRNYTHSIWLSYIEVYNEKVYDLLAATAASPTKFDSRSGPTSSTLLLSRKALAMKPSPPSDCDGSQGAGRYISGLRQIRVHSASQAKALLKRGQLHRKVFGTLANSQSSRSHALVTIKILRGHRGEYDVSSMDTCRLDLHFLNILCTSESIFHTNF
jgi:kinesin family member 20